MPCFPCQKGAEYLEDEENHGLKNRLDRYDLLFSSLEKVIGVVVVSRIDRHYLPLKDLYKRIYILNKWSFDYFDSTRFPVLW